MHSVGGEIGIDGDRNNSVINLNVLGTFIVWKSHTTTVISLKSSNGDCKRDNSLISLPMFLIGTECI